MTKVSDLTTGEKIELIKKARNKIYFKKHWTQSAIARNKDGEIVGVRDRNAVCWCAIGALDVVCPTEWHFTSIMDIIYKVTYTNSIININDLEGHAAVIRIFNKAIKILTLKLENETGA